VRAMQPRFEAGALIQGAAAPAADAAAGRPADAAAALQAVGCAAAARQSSSAACWSWCVGCVWYEGRQLIAGGKSAVKQRKTDCSENPVTARTASTGTAPHSTTGPRMRQAGARRPARRAAEGARQRLDFELPYAGKILLLAAYVCSCNAPALDRRLFDPSARAGRRRGAMAADRQARCRRTHFP